MKTTITRTTGTKSTHRVAELSRVIESLKVESKSEPVDKVRYQIRIFSGKGRPMSLNELSRINFTTHFRNRDGVLVFTAYNGLVLVTIDHLSGLKEAAHIRNKVIRLPSCLLAFTGSSGHTVKALLHFTLPDGTLPTEERNAQLFHVHAYRWAVNYIRSQFPENSVRIHHPSLTDSCRFSYDPGLCYKENSYPILLDQPLQMPEEVLRTEEAPPKRSPLEQLAPGIERYRLSQLLFENAFTRALNETGLTGETRESKKLLEVLGRTCYESGIPEEEATQWTVERFLKEIEPVVIRLTFHNIYTTRKGFGEKPYIMPKQSLYLQTEEFMNRCYEFRYNKQTASVEYRQKKSFFFDFKPIDNRVLNSIAVKAMSEGIEIWDKDVRRWIESDKVRIYSPVEEFIYKLPEWDEKERIRAFASRVSCGNPHWPELFHRWFLGMVAQWIGRSARHANSVAPLLIGNQGCGKSTFCRMILPPELHTYYTDRIDFTLKKEAELYLNRFALINMDEFDQISPKEQAFLKHILQKPVIQTRKPHQSQIQSLNRYASFIGTSNHPDLLTDTSGSRRFICIRVEGTIDNLTPVNYYQLYAQAFEELQHGTRHWFDEKEESLISEYNQEFEQRTPIEQLFCQYYRAPRPGEVPQKLLAVEIFENIRKKSRLALPQTKITSFGRILKKLDIPVQRTQYGNCYLVVEIPQV